MSLPMLVNGADCGPSNALQSLTKQVDRDRGVSQDLFGRNKSGSSSSQVFHTAPAFVTNKSDQESARNFFRTSSSSSSSKHIPQLLQAPATPHAYDLTSLRQAMPSVYSQDVKSPATANWAMDFMSQSPALTVSPNAMSDVQSSIPRMQSPAIGAFNYQQQMRAPGISSQFMPPAFQQPVLASAVPTQNSQVSWDASFDSFADRSLEEPIAGTSQQHEQESDELSRTAGRLIDVVQSSFSPSSTETTDVQSKFSSSAFMGLMQKLRDRETVVEGNDMVPAAEASSSWVQDFAKADIKGKGKAVDPSQFAPITTGVGASFASPETQRQRHSVHNDGETDEDRFWKQENADFQAYWQQANSQAAPSKYPMTEAEWARERGLASSSYYGTTAQQEEWGKLQSDWEAFEANELGTQQLSQPKAGQYVFQKNNPYVRHQQIPSGDSSLDNLLELESRVLSNETSPTAWLALGLKQQSLERETQAISALERAIELDPSLGEAWLGLSVSYTNDTNSYGVGRSVDAWVRLRLAEESKYSQLNQRGYELSAESSRERMNGLASILMEMARVDQETGSLDADLQMALAVLFYTTEDYSKAHDCFHLALSLTDTSSSHYPVLCNRVGATLANSGKSEEALLYYARALEINPGYVRARYNLGISCVGLGRYEEAAQHMLNALSFQDADASTKEQDEAGITSTTMWSSLKTTFLHMERLDLAQLCDRHDLDAVRSSVPF